jgi:D-alanyl-D-alanine dipeptidase
MSRLVLHPLVLALAAAGCGGGAPPTTPPPAPVAADSAFTPAGDAAADTILVDIRTVDSTIAIDTRYAGPDNFTGAPLPGYQANRIFLRREVAAALGRVQARLRTGGLGLRVFDGYRPVRATLAMMDWAERTGQRALVDSGYIARRSRHNLGIAVDLTLLDLETGTEVPMGTPYDTFAPEAHTENAQGRVRRYRQILVRVMESEGFTNYEKEWWHFSYPVEGAVAFDRVVR